MAIKSEMFHVGVVLTPEFSLMAFASLVEPLRAANLLNGVPLYRWTHLSPDGGALRSSGGLDVLTEALPPLQSADFDMFVICGGLGDETYTSLRLRDYLRQLMRRDVIIGSVSTASFILAAAGVLDGRRCTVHWDYLDAFREAYPRLDVRNELFVIDKRVFTCAGGVAAMDAILEVIRQRQGHDFANRVSENFVYGTIRQAADSQRMTLRNRLGIAHPVMLKTVEIMEAAVETPMRLPQIALEVGVSTRQLERLFYRYFGCSPAQHYIRVRLEKARKLLRHTTMPILEIGIACGFTSASHFARAYRRHFGVVPSADRRPAPVSFGGSEKR
ncbi:GlxA family transcriptional regulator [Rhodoligotrophos defluvii]|uniref:GlxA family transcriptional regulator n=1 Tax=Rhodoligotrophos defluvii TaxID=2561934 RepID=UPI001485BB0C|nr:GlxA family transcriptional regulator [Rhodoligotrophos defluvii]